MALSLKEEVPHFHRGLGVYGNTHNYRVVVDYHIFPIAFLRDQLTAHFGGG